ncbi:formate-dependent nitrite reductase complex subunit NrfG, partial [mine drainage metagenome]
MVCAVACGGRRSAVYLKSSNWPWKRYPGVASPQSPIITLIDHLDRDPKDIDDWLKLGRSYIIVQEYPFAVRAFARANLVAGGRNATALVGEAEALILIHDSSLEGRAGQLIDEALAIDPTSPQALFFGAAEAMRLGDLPLARTRFSKLLAMNPPAQVKTMLKQEITAIDAKLDPKIVDPAGKT